jgi:hypothetical protein
MRLIRKIMSLYPELFPSSLLMVMVAIANDGSKEHDKLVKACLASICELGTFLSLDILLSDKGASRCKGGINVLANID